MCEILYVLVCLWVYLCMFDCVLHCICVGVLTVKCVYVPPCRLSANVYCVCVSVHLFIHLYAIILELLKVYASTCRYVQGICIYSLSLHMCSHAVYYLHNAVQGVGEFFMQTFAWDYLFIQSSKNCVIRELQHKYPTFHLHSILLKQWSLSTCFQNTGFLRITLFCFIIQYTASMILKTVVLEKSWEPTVCEKC